MDTQALHKSLILKFESNQLKKSLIIIKEPSWQQNVGTKERQLRYFETEVWIFLTLGMIPQYTYRTGTYLYLKYRYKKMMRPQKPLAIEKI